MQLDQLLGDLKRFGDRTSSFNTLFTSFNTYRVDSTPEMGQIRYVETKNYRVAATEPIADVKNRRKLAREFALSARQAGKSTLLFPVGESFSREMLFDYWHREQVGVEAIFELRKYFSGPDPLERRHHARVLSRRGGSVRELKIDELDYQLRSRLDQIKSEWVSNRQSIELSFLSQVNPLEQLEHKRIFILETNGEIMAYVVLVPIFSVCSYFACDWIRDKRAKAGSIELLLIQTMKILEKEGVAEVRLGLAPLADIRSNTKVGRLLKFIFHYGNDCYPFRSLYEFKKKLGCTRWDPLYLVSDKPIRLKALSSVLQVHFPKGITLKAFEFYFKKRVSIPAIPLTRSGFFQSISTTLGFILLLSVLHLIKALTEAGNALYHTAGYQQGALTFSGWFMGPLLHNTNFHFFGDIFSYLLFGFFCNWIFGRTWMIVLTGLGLWASNPITVLMLLPLKFFEPGLWQSVLLERDYGSSNAVFVFVGAFGVLLKRPLVILGPFIAYAIVICTQNASILALHHLVALAFGCIAGHLWMNRNMTRTQSKI